MDCPDACSLLVSRMEDGRVKIRGNPDNRVTAGFTCSKIGEHIKRLQHPDRITTPLMRSGNRWQPISWDAALQRCAQKIQELRHEPKAILHVKGDGAKGVLHAATSWFFAALGTSRTKGSLCDAAGYMAYVRDFGSRENHDVRDLLNAGCIVNWGKDLSRSSIHTAAVVRKARRQGTRVLTVSPGGDGNDSFSDERIRIRPGTDRFLAAAAIRLLIERNLVDPRVMQHSRNFDAFRALVLRHPQKASLAACEVSPDDAERLLRFYTGEHATASLVGAGLQRYSYGGENVRFINALAFAAGHIGRPGGGSHFHLHSYRNLNLAWIEDHERKPRRLFSIPTIGSNMLAAQNPPIRMLWVNGTNLVNQAPDSTEIARALDRVEFKVVVDAFMNDTASRADLVLPCTLMLEQEDILGSYLHEHVQYARKVLDPPGEARSDWWILSEVGRRLDPPLVLPDAEICFRQALASPYLNTSLEELRRKGCVQANRPSVAYAGLTCGHRDGRYRFPRDLHPEPPAPADFPLRLLTLIRREVIHSQMLPEQQINPPRVWVAPDCLALEHIDIDRDVYLVSPLGRMHVTLENLDGLHSGAVVYRRGDWMNRGGGANQLIRAGLTDIGLGAPFYDQYVRLENG
jgi:anaerobic selenocysteine-containing dehydrogenase